MISSTDTGVKNCKFICDDEAGVGGEFMFVSSIDVGFRYKTRTVRIHGGIVTGITEESEWK